MHTGASSKSIRFLRLYSSPCVAHAVNALRRAVGKPGTRIMVNVDWTLIRGVLLSHVVGDEALRLIGHLHKAIVVLCVSGFFLHANCRPA